MDTTTSHNRESLTKSPNRLVATIFGAIYLLIGLLGFLITSGVGFASNEGEPLLGVFEVNPLHNIVHLLIGAYLLYSGLKTVKMAKAANTTVGAVYFLVGVIGLFLVDSHLNFLALNSADNVLHFLSALILLGVGIGLERTVSDHRTPTGSIT